MLSKVCHTIRSYSTFLFATSASFIIEYTGSDRKPYKSSNITSLVMGIYASKLEMFYNLVTVFFKEN